MQNFHSDGAKLREIIEVARRESLKERGKTLQKVVKNFVMSMIYTNFADSFWYYWVYEMSASFTYKEIFERIYTENYVRLYYYALHIVNEEETAKDILNDVFTVLWKNISHVESSNVNAYLMTSVRNKAVDYLRRNVLQSHYSEEYLHTAEQFYTDYSNEKDQLVEEMLGQLTPPTDQILEMCYLRRMKYAEVAEALHISTSTVKKHIMKALKTLRELYRGRRECPI